MTAPAEEEEPSVRDLRARLRPAGDQGRRGTCVAFAVTAIHEARPSTDGDDDIPEDLAEEVLFWGAKQIDGNLADGTRFTSADIALQRWGQPAEALWPYDDRRDHRAATYQPPVDAIDPVNCHFSALRPLAVSIDAIRRELDAGLPVVIGLPVWDGLRHAATEPLPAPHPTDIYPTRHAVVAVGHDPSAGAVLIRNSWGRRWGTDGHLWIDAAVLDLATGAWVIDTTGSASAAAPAIADNEVLT